MRFGDPSSEPFDHGDADELGGPELDADFPLGDGTAETEATVVCPYCAEAVQISLDPGSGTTQDYVEDCQVCQPWRVNVWYDDEGMAEVAVTPLDS
jgi:hypothetical protein